MRRTAKAEQRRLGCRSMRPTYSVARKQYLCDGCGEITIYPGDRQMTMATVDAAGCFHRSRYCIRCIVAIEAKKRNSPDGDIAVSNGDLRMSRLSNTFRKSWNWFVPEFCRTQDREERRALMIKLYERIGIDPNAKIESARAKPRKTQKEKEEEMGKIEELERSVRREKRRARQLAEEIERCNQRVAVCQLALKLAMTRGDHRELHDRCNELVELKRSIDELCAKLKDNGQDGQE